MKWMGVVGVILLIVLYFSVKSLNEDIKRLDEIELEYKGAVGDTIILGSDTSQVVDYSILGATLTLSNNMTISMEFYRKQKGE